jgi:Asp-tRNA(Asn)/Glu-tRNA(Gln) amidotransferase C subunit
MDFLFHNLSEKEREEIRKQVKDILNSFSAKLSEIKENVKDNSIEMEKFERHEGFQKDESFSREIMFKNAPDKKNDFIIGEKKSWK